MVRDIFRYLSSIVLCIIVVIFSLFMWEKFREKTAIIENVVAQNNIELISGKSLNQDNLELAIINGSYTVLNNSKYNVSADLVFKLDKSSEIKGDDLLIYLDDYNCELSFLYQNSDQNYDIFLLKRFNLNGKEKRTYNIKLAIKKENYDLVKGKKYKYKIETNTLL
jgi:hypothetical protein